jgi:hypothetical protein
MNTPLPHLFGGWLVGCRGSSFELAKQLVFVSDWCFSVQMPSCSTGTNDKPDYYCSALRIFNPQTFLPFKTAFQLSAFYDLDLTSSIFSFEVKKQLQAKFQTQI